MTQKIIISKPTFNALTETDAKNLIFSSDLNHLKTAVSGNFEQTGNDTITVAHNLGYRPLVICYFYETTDTSTWYISLSASPQVGSPNRHTAPANISLYIDTTNVYFKVGSNIGQTIHCEYEIFFEGDA